MNEQMVLMGPISVIAGLGAGWLADTFLHRRGFGLIVDMGLGVVASLCGAGTLVALGGLLPGILAVFVVAFGLAASVILSQRICWPCEREAWELEARLRLAELDRPPHGATETLSRAGTWALRADSPLPVPLNPRVSETAV